MSKAKKKNKKKLKSLILLLLLTVIMLSTTTYAWFTSNKSVKIDTIDVYIAASSGLQISSNAVSWKTVISNTDITTGYDGHTNNLSTELTPVSTDGTVSSGELKMWKGTVEGADSLGGDMGLTAVASGEDSGEFIVFDVFFKVDTDTQVYLDNGSGVTVKSGATDKGLQNAARYGFVIEGNNADTTLAATNYTSMSSGSSSIIVEPNYDAHTDSGVSNAQLYYNIATTSGTSGVAPVNYVGVKAAISDPILLRNTNPGGSPNSTYFAAISNLLKTNVAYSNSGTDYASYVGTTAQTTYLPVFSLEAGVTKVRVYMWIEGQDVDCENNASGADLTYSLKFTILDGPVGS